MKRGAALSLLLLTACGRCGAAPDALDAGPRDAREVPDLLPMVPPFDFREVRGAPPFAVPDGCQLRAPLLRAAARPTTGFFTEPRSLATLIVGEASDGSVELAASGAMRFDAAGALLEQRPVPWRSPHQVPHLARDGGGGWLGALDDREGGEAARALLWRGDKVELIGAGDGFEAVDLRCARGRCALLTSRMGRVAMPGAEVRVGPADAPIAAWRTLTIEPASAGSDARPLGLVGWEARDAGPRAHDTRAGAALSTNEADLRAAVLERDACAVFALDPGGARETARLPAPHGVLDIAALPEPTAMVHGAQRDDDGCAAEGAASVRFVQAGSDAEVRTPAPPSSGALRPLARGALATWIAPLGCKVSRTVVYAVRLDETGHPTGAAFPIGDADRYAVASEGNDVDLWLQELDAVTWMRLRCGG